MFKGKKEFVKIVEVGPRDGLQNEKAILTLEDKLKYIKLLMQTGLKTIEPTSFVRPDKIPQMADAEKLFKEVKSFDNFSDYSFPCLVPNIKGYELAKRVGVKEISLFSATSDAFTKKNINCTIDESFARMKQVAKSAKKDNIKIRAYISTAFGCPYAGKVEVSELIKVVEKFLNFGVYELSIGDTIGVATPGQVYDSIKAMSSVVSLEKLAMHFHDTRGMAIANILTALEGGIKIFDSSSGGLGGCPYAKGASGNVATEEVIYLLDSLGLETGVSIEKLRSASKFILEKVNRLSPSKYFRVLELENS